MKTKNMVVASRARKQTVTITLGPKTLERLELWRRSVADDNPGIALGLTDVAGAAVMRGLVDWLRAHAVTVDLEWRNIHQ